MPREHAVGRLGVALVSALLVSVSGKIDEASSIPERPGDTRLRGIHHLHATTIHGETVSLLKYHRGKAPDIAIVVNVAGDDDLRTERQYFQLQALHEEYGERGVTILAFPTDQFGDEWETDEDIWEHAHGNYRVSFPMFTKGEVNGPNAHPIFKLVKETIGGGEIQSNFEKFLVVNGIPMKRYPSEVNPWDISPDIYDVLRGRKLRKSLKMQIHSKTTHDGTPTRAELKKYDHLNNPTEQELDENDETNLVEDKWGFYDDGTLHYHDHDRELSADDFAAIEDQLRQDPELNAELEDEDDEDM